MLKRLPWNPGRNYPVLVASPYNQSWAIGKAKKKAGIANHPEHQAASKGKDVDAALKIVKQALDSAYLSQLRLYLKQLEAQGIKDPILVAAYKRGSKNMLPRTAAVFLAEELGLEVDHRIVALPSDSMHKMDKLQRLFSNPKFAGGVKDGRHYICVDDVVSSAATMASLRSHIESNGGRFLTGAALASPTGQSMILNPTKEQISGVVEALGHDLTKWLENRTRLTLGSITRPEARFLCTREAHDQLSGIARFTA